MKERQFPDLRDFLSYLRDEGEMAIVEAPVDPDQEAAEIHRRVIAAEGPALLFNNVKGSQFPLVMNLFGTRRRAEAAFGNKPFHLIRSLVSLVQEFPPRFSTLWKNREVALAGLHLGTRRRRSGPVTEVIDLNPDLKQLPVITCWPEDGGPFLTLPLVYTTSPEQGGPNLGIYRMQVLSSRETGMHWQIGKGGGFHYAVAEERGESLPVTVFLGGPPSLVLSAVAPLPENVPELLLASLILGRRLDVVSGQGPHPLLAGSEFALLGQVRPGKRKPEGPFGDHYGYYSLIHEYPVFEVERICRRKDAIFPATVVGKPRQEDFYIGDLLQELLRPIFPLVMPAVKDIWAYGETGYHSLAAAVVRQRYPREAMASAFRILGEGQLSLTKFLMVTDETVDLREFRKTLTHILERTDPETDLYVFSNLSMDTLDYTGPRVNEGSKGVWLGLGKPKRKLPREFSSSEVPAAVTGVHVFSPGCLVVGGPSYQEDESFARRLAQHEGFSDWPLIVLSDEPQRAVRSETNFLWTTFTRFEPAADLYASQTSVSRHHLSYRFPIVIDARIKPPYPKELSCAPEVARLVTRRWKEYFPGGVEMGDSERGHLD